MQTFILCYVMLLLWTLLKRMLKLIIVSLTVQYWRGEKRAVHYSTQEYITSQQITGEHNSVQYCNVMWTGVEYSTVEWIAVD